MEKILIGQIWDKIGVWVAAAHNSYNLAFIYSNFHQVTEKNIAHPKPVNFGVVECATDGFRGMECSAQYFEGRRNTIPTTEKKEWTLLDSGK